MKGNPNLKNISADERQSRRGSKRHLDKEQVNDMCRFIKAGSRYPERDECMVRLAFEHGLRVNECVSIRWQDINLKRSTITISRLKGGMDGTNPILDRRLLKLLVSLHKSQDKPTTGYVFRNERGGVVSGNSFQKLVNKYSELATGIKFNAHALRHGCGTTMIEAGYDIRIVQQWMGHSNIVNTTKYLHESSTRFNGVKAFV